jgi:hypothetical protein
VSYVGIVNASKASIIALLLNDLESLNNLILVQHCVEAELGELLREVVRWDVDQAVVRLRLGRRVGRKGKVAHDEIVVLVSHMLVKDDLVHALRKLKINLR